MEKPLEMRVDDEASLLPMAESVDGVVDELRSQVKRIVVERMKEEAEMMKKADAERLKNSFIIRMDEQGSIVTEVLDGSGGGGPDATPLVTVADQRLENYSDLEAAFEEDRKHRKSFITLLRMTIHLLLPTATPTSATNSAQAHSTSLKAKMHGLSDDVVRAVEKVFFY